MNSIDQINPFVPANRVKRRQKPKDRKDNKRDNSDHGNAPRKRGPRDGHRVDELA